MPDSLPQPMTPPHCDLRFFCDMRLDVQRFLDSGLAVEVPDAEARYANVVAQAVAWHQVPAASLPDDDRLLCWLLRFGREVEHWQRLRAAGALHGFVKCSDGRLYHPEVAEKARTAFGMPIDIEMRARPCRA